MYPMCPKNRVYCAFGYACNNNCLVCAVDAKAHAMEEVPTDEVIRFIDSLSAKTDEMELSGGEPTMRKDFLHLTEYIHSKGISYMILSNGRQFSNPFLANKISMHPPENVMVPLHGADSKTHDLLSGANGSFNETIEGMKNIIEYGITLTPKIVVNKLNTAELPRVVDLVGLNFPECKTLTINALDYTGCALKNKDTIGITFSEAAPHIGHAIDSGNSIGLRVRLYTIPICVLGEEYRENVGVKPDTHLRAKTPSMNGRPVPRQYGQIDKCSSCTKKHICTGTWHNYYQLYGTNEIEPI